MELVVGEDQRVELVGELPRLARTNWRRPSPSGIDRTFVLFSNETTTGWAIPFSSSVKADCVRARRRRPAGSAPPRGDRAGGDGTGGRRGSASRARRRTAQTGADELEAPLAIWHRSNVRAFLERNDDGLGHSILLFGQGRLRSSKASKASRQRSSARGSRRRRWNWW